MAFPSLARALEWLRAGYPQGMPQQDYVALLGVLARRLTAAEVDEIAHTLVREGLMQATDEQIGDAIRHAHLTPPTQEDVDRVGTHLDAAAWTRFLEAGFR